MVALLGSLAVPARAATTTYDTNNTPYAGGTIDPGDTVLLNDGATVTGDITDNGTLQFNQSGTTLTISNVISGTGTLSLTNTGTLNLTGTSGAANTVVLDMITSASAGLLQIRSGTGTLWVGNSGTGILNVTGGQVSNRVGTLGRNSNSVGTATVSSGTWAKGSDLNVGFNGTGTLNVTGGYVSNATGFLGTDPGGNGTANVSSGTWANSGVLFVGRTVTGTLNVTGGRVTNMDGYLGYFDGSVGTATVSSGTWDTSGELIVGYSGTGTLNVSGGSVTNSQVFLGDASGSVGTATVTSGTWANSGNLAVGRSGTGTLTMNGGLVVVSGSLSKNAASTINLNAGGTLQIGTGTTGGVLLGGTGSLVNNGTLVFKRSDASTYSGVLSGSGAVNKQAAGTLTLAGANSYTGVTTISAGTLALSGAGGIGTGGLNLGTTGSPGVFGLLGLTAGIYSLPSSANLAGVGTISGNGKSLAVLGSLTPGNSVGTITVGSGLSVDLSLSGSSVFEITSPAFTAGSFDLVSGDGSVVFGGILNIAFSGGSYAAGTDVLQIFANAGGRLGNFSAVNATGLADGQSATFNPATGIITVVLVPAADGAGCDASPAFLPARPINQADLAVCTATHRESLERKGGPGAIAQQVFETPKIAGHVAVDERDPDTRVDGKPAVLPGEHVGGGSGVEQASEPEPADHAAAHPLCERGQIGLVDRSGRQERR